MSSIADRLMERRAALITQAQEVAQLGVTEDRDLTIEEQTRFDQMMAEVDALHKRAEAIADGEKRGKDLDESFRRLVPGAVEDKREERDSKRFESWAREARLGDIFEVSPIRGAEARAITAARGQELRAGMSASGGVGDDAVYGRLWQYAIAQSYILQSGVEVINTTDGNTLPFPVATVHAATDDSAVAANAAITEADSTVTTVNLAVSKYGFVSLVPTELVQDATFDLEGYIGRNAGRQLGRRVSQVAAAALIADFTTAGVTGPVGTSVSLGDQSTVGEGTDLLVDLYHSVLPEYRTGAAFLMADPTAAAVRKLKSTSTGESVWQGALVAGDPDMLLGKPVYIVPELPSMAADAKPIYFGDVSALKVRIAGGIRFERSNEYAFNSDQVAFRALVRCGAAGLDPNAVKYLANSAT